MSPWFQLLLKRLAVGEPQVLGLLAGNPLPNGPAEFIRITLYQYRFTSAAKARETGHWWNRKLVWRGPAWALGP
ncbi:MAG: lipase maturation factor family protein [Planctomycetes bacterium]|nr:lipase maturation factor family protein [Planctomycetota bacterium]